MQRLSEIAAGRWHGLLPRFGIDPSHLTGKHTACPTCGGRDRFRFDNREGRGTWICNKCGAGDGIALVQRVKGWDFRRVAQEVEAILAKVELIAPRARRSVSDQRAAMNRLWLAARAVEQGDVVDQYLFRRLGKVQPYFRLRTAGEIIYRDDTGSSLLPAMLAMVTDAAGCPVNLHRTFLTFDGHKAAVNEPKKLMPGPLPKGSAVRLTPTASTLGIAEGIETALAATILSEVPCWSALNANLLKSWVPPSGVSQVIIFADNDHSFTGQSAAYELAGRLLQHKLAVDVRIPDAVGQDWAEVLALRRHE